MNASREISPGGDRLSKSSVIRLAGGASQATRSAGSAVDEVTRALGPLGGAGATYELVHRTREKDDATGAEQQRTDTTVVSADMGSVLMHSGESQGTPMEIQRPVTLLPRSPQPGQRWDVGSFEMSGMEFDLRGEVLGFEDVRTPAGDFRRCLKLRFRAAWVGSSMWAAAAYPSRMPASSRSSGTRQGSAWCASAPTSASREAPARCRCARPSPWGPWRRAASGGPASCPRSWGRTRRRPWA